MELVTGFKGKAHVTSENMADLYRGIFGPDSYVLETGRQFEASLVSNNLLKIYDGCAVFQGRQIVIPRNMSDELTIGNGTQNEKRIDLVVVRYTKNTDTGVEETNLKVIKGIPTSGTPVTPAYSVGDIRAGDKTVDLPLYSVHLNGISVTEVKKMFATNMSLTKLNSNLGYVAGTINGINYKKHNDGILEMWGRTESGTGSAATINFPIPFTNSNYILTASPEYHTNFEVWLCSVQANTLNKAYVYTRQRDGGTLVGVHVHWRAIGRWK